MPINGQKEIWVRTNCSTHRSIDVKAFKYCKGKTWKIVDSKRVWFEKEDL